jgi:AraC-like DNA-binding protein
MSNRFKKFDWSVVSPGKCKTLPGPAIWLIKSVSENLLIDLEFFDSRREILLDPDRSALIARTTGVKMVSRAGAWRFQKIPLFEAAKLLAFLESYASADSPGGSAHGDIVVSASSDLSIWKFEGWLIERVMCGDRSAGGMFDFLRSQESYGLVRFLLKERASVKTVGALSERYGVSESHFRRLCRRALGRGLKRELRQWRAASAVLDVVESRDSMTDVAMSNGFASSSHFSREIKDLFGISPCQFRRRT